MEMPKPTPEHARLAAFIGNWIGEEKIHPSPFDPAGGTATATVASRLTCEGLCLVTDYSEERGGVVTYVGHGVTGYDTARQVYLQHWSDSMGGVPGEAKPGHWIGDTLTFQASGPHGHARYTYRVVSPTRYDFRIDHSHDGVQWAAFMEATYERAALKRPAPAAPRKPAKKRPARSQPARKKVAKKQPKSDGKKGKKGQKDKKARKARKKRK